jgi:hypothetical protein
MSNFSNDSIISKNTYDKIVQIMTQVYNRPLLSFTLIQIIFMIWFYISFRYIDSDNKIKNISSKTIIYKYLYFVLPFHILFFCDMLVRKKIITYHQYIIIAGLVLMILHFSWFYVSMTNIEKDPTINKLTLSQVFVKYIIYTSPIIIFMLLVIFNLKNIGKLGVDIYKLSIKSN